MARSAVYQLRLTHAEKDQLAQMARERNVSIAKLIRERVLGQSFPVARSSTAEQPPVKRPVEGSTPSAPVIDEVLRKVQASRLQQRVNELRPLMSKPNAERVARTELGLD